MYVIMSILLQNIIRLNRINIFKKSERKGHVNDYPTIQYFRILPLYLFE